MNVKNRSSLPKAKKLLDVIHIQTEIAKAGLDLGEVMALICQHSRILTEADGAVIELVEGDDMVYRAASGIAESQLGLRLRRDGSLSGACVKEREILTCVDSDLDERVDREACRKVGLRSMIVVPLNHLEDTVGVLKVISKSVHAFNDEDIQILGLMSELIAASMYNASHIETNELYHRATHDSHTGLANRALFYDRLRQSLAYASRHSHQLGILNLDMDGLKPINDQYGHRAGDAAIKELAARIKNISRDSDTVARVGGDEFAIILSRIESRDGAEQQSKRLSESISRPFIFEDKSLPLAASIGLAVFPQDGEQIDTLLEIADVNMYQTKRARVSMSAKNC
jgi:diguanylate cyclase